MRLPAATGVVWLAEADEDAVGISIDHLRDICSRPCTSPIGLADNRQSICTDIGGATLDKQQLGRDFTQYVDLKSDIDLTLKRSGCEIERKKSGTDCDDWVLRCGPKLNVVVGNGNFPSFISSVAIYADEFWVLSIRPRENDMIGNDERCTKLWSVIASKLGVRIRKIKCRKEK